MNAVGELVPLKPTKKGKPASSEPTPTLGELLPIQAPEAVPPPADVPPVEPTPAEPTAAIEPTPAAPVEPVDVIDGDWLPGDVLWYWMSDSATAGRLEPKVVILRRRFPSGLWQFTRFGHRVVEGTGKPSREPRVGHITERVPAFLTK